MSESVKHALQEKSIVWIKYFIWAQFLTTIVKEIKIYFTNHDFNGFYFAYLAIQIYVVGYISFELEITNCNVKVIFCQAVCKVAREMITQMQHFISITGWDQFCNFNNCTIVENVTNIVA